MSPRYDADPEPYFDWSETREPPSAAANANGFRLEDRQVDAVEALLTTHGIEQDAKGLFEFIRGAIEAREYAKFVFTRSVSDALELIAEFGAEHGLEREDCSHLDYARLRSLFLSADNPRRVLRASVREGRHSAERARQICLPALITDPDQVYSFHHPSSEPNYVTQGSARGRVEGVDADALEGAIVFMASADPGYDWIFSRRVAGFVTKYGGMNSHMAIRAGELQIPAVIGAGEVLFETWRSARVIELDCGSRQVRVLR